MQTKCLNWLRTNEACSPSIRWIKQNNIQSLEDAWHACERGDWLFWMAKRLGISKRKLALGGALCAHTVVHLMTDSRSREAVRITFLWGRGKASDKQLREAREAAAAAAADAAAYAAYAAAYAADVAAEAAYAAADAAWQENQLRTAEIVRKILTNDVMKKIKEIK